MLLYIGRGGLFIGAADFAHHDNSIGRSILFEKPQAVDEIHAAYGIAAYTDAGRLPQTVIGGLINRLVSQRA